MAPLINSTTYELKVRTKSVNLCSLYLVKGLIIQLGIPENEIVELSEQNKNSLAVYFSSYKKIKSFKSKIEKLQLKNVAIKIKSLKKSDWLTKWKKDFKPFILTKSFGVVPSWLKGKYKFKTRENIYIDTNLAFGTGMHPTTKFVANFIESCRGKFKSFLDVGTGTGILSLIASRCHADYLCSVDISRDCIKCTKENFLLNEVKSPILKVCDFAYYKSRKKYDLVAANLTTNDLMRFKNKIASFISPNKYLAISGVSLENYKLIKGTFEKLSLKCLKEEIKQGWVAFLFKKGDIS